jgi:hypothetical protein
MTHELMSAWSGFMADLTLRDENFFMAGVCATSSLWLILTVLTRLLKD